jgi:hypothetical protein
MVVEANIRAIQGLVVQGCRTMLVCRKRNVVRRKRVTTTQQTKILQSADTEKRTYRDALITSGRY